MSSDDHMGVTYTEELAPLARSCTPTGRKRSWHVPTLAG